MKYYVKEYERLMKFRFPACTKAFGKLPIEQGFTILDLKGVGVSLLTPKVKYNFNDLLLGYGIFKNSF